jgi:hypothetical protein
MHLIFFSNFLQVLYRARKLHTKNYYFSKCILFSTIYLVLKYEFNHNNYSVQETNMRNFVQASEYEVYMYAKFGYLGIYRFL